MSLNQFKTRLAASIAFSEILRVWQDSSGISLKNTSGSYLSFLSYCLIQEKNGNHLFILPDKEDALYFFNDLENLFNSERGTTLLFYPASYRRPYQIMDSDATSVLQRTEVLDALGKERKKLIVVTYPEAIVEKVIEKKNFEKNNLTISVGEELELDLMDEILIDLDFEKVDYVYEPGQFAIRGGIIDVFSFNYEMPYVGVLPTLPSIDNTFEVSKLTQLVKDFVDQGENVWIDRSVTNDTYWSGKAYGKVAELIAISQSIGLTEESTRLTNWLKLELED